MFFIMGITQGRKDFEYSHVIICSHCGYETQEDFEFCPKCGNKF